MTTAFLFGPNATPAESAMLFSRLNRDSIPLSDDENSSTEDTEKLLESQR